MSDNSSRQSGGSTRDDRLQRDPDPDLDETVDNDASTGAGAGTGADRAADNDASADLEHLATLVADLEENSTELVEYGADHDLPAIEHTADRIGDLVRRLEAHVPQEQIDDPQDPSADG